MGEQKNLLLAILVSLVVLLSFQLMFPGDKSSNNVVSTNNATEQNLQPFPEINEEDKPREEIINASNRVNINNSLISGSLSLTGARIDDIILKNYFEDLSTESDYVKLLSPKGTKDSYYAEYGWLKSNNSNIKLPDENSVWTSNNTEINPNSSTTLTWDNGEGIIFKRTIKLDKEYMFEIKQTVINNSNEDITLYPYASINRKGFPKLSGLYILHEGLIGVIENRLQEVDYDDLEDTNEISELSSSGGWIGITDKYWLAALIPNQESKFKGYFQSFNYNSNPSFQSSFTGSAINLKSNNEASYSSKLYIGAKELDILDRHEKSGIPMFDKAVDFGWFYIITKPLFYLLTFFSNLLGNVGLAIIALTICIRILLFPLANKSFKSMNKMKILQPKMMEIRERYGNDKMQMQKEVMALYKKEKANPLAGCLPILLQIPVFFALYKVLFVTIEMRQMPFYGWIQDLSERDPTSIFNLFGLLPYDVPSFLVIGAWPVAMGVSMWIQQKLNPAPTDAMQAKIFAFFPLFLTVILAPFPSGLVIYWTVNNILTMAQQVFIMRRTTVKTVT